MQHALFDFKRRRNLLKIFAPDEGSQGGCTMSGVFYCSEKGQAIPQKPLQGFHKGGTGRLPGNPERNVRGNRVLLCMETCEELRYNFDVGRDQQIGNLRRRKLLYEYRHYR